jgi:hypothetical protein
MYNPCSNVEYSAQIGILRWVPFFSYVRQLKHLGSVFLLPAYLPRHALFLRLFSLPTYFLSDIYL